MNARDGYDNTPLQLAKSGRLSESFIKSMDMDGTEWPKEQERRAGVAGVLMEFGAEE